MKKLFPALVISIALVPVGFALADPTLSPTPDITAEATSSAGAYVDFNITATDATDTTDAVVCTPPSGSLFALGTTPVSCTASDSSFSTTTAMFNVIVQDTTPPVITPPPTQYFATSTFPAIPALTFATATDAVDPDPAITVSTTTFDVGTTTVTWTATDASGNSSATTSLVVVTDDSATSTTPDTATISIRDGATFIGPVSVTLPDVSAPAVAITPTGTTTSEDVPARSVLALLENLQAATSSFAITELDYYDSYAEFYLNCIAVPASNPSPDCGNWQYEVDGVAPAESLDQETLGNGDSAILYFGSPWQISVSTSSVETGETFTATAQQYDPTSGNYVPAVGDTVGVVQFDSNYNAIEFATSTTDANGNATLSVPLAGSYEVGIEESGYYPTVDLTVSSSTPSSNPGGGGGGGGGGISHFTFNISAALSYLSSKQAANGSYDTADITDWAAIAFAAENPGAALTSIKEYELSAEPAMSSITDYERHAMALMALGINPYDGTSVNYIAPIVASFDGTQIGDPTEDNDDIFGLLVLEHAGYAPTDPLIAQDAAYLLTKQQPDGSWDESPDLTAAAIDALGPLLTTPQSAAALGEAVGYVMSQQQTNGGWSTIDSTSWVQTAINGIIAEQTPGFSNETAFASPSGFYPTDALAEAQQQDGAVQPASDPVDTRVWSTSYAVVAASGKDWQALLGEFSAPTGTTGGGGGGGAVAATSTASTTAATSTAATATTETATTTAATSSPQTASTTVPLPITPRIGTIIRAAAITPAPSAPAPAEQTAATQTPATATPAVLGAATSSQLAGAAASIGGFSGWQRVFAIFAMIFALILAGVAFFPRRFA